MRNLFSVLALVFLFAPPAHAQSDQPWYWSVAAATGVVDESGLSSVSFSDTGSAAIKASVSSADIKLRYAIGNGPSQLNLFDAVPCLLLSYRDTGAGARVIVTLKAMNNTTGEQFVIGRFDSDASGGPASDQYQTGQVCPMGPLDPSGQMQHFNNRDFDYFIDAELIKSSSAANPGIKVIRLGIQ